MRVTPKPVVGGGDVHVRLLGVFSNKFAWVLVHAQTFHTMLTQEERQAFAQLYPREFLKMWGFERHGLEHFPSAADHQTRFFRRWDILQYLEVHPVAHTRVFDAPDLRSVQYADRYMSMARARARWWIECKLPVLETELEWLKRHAPNLLPAADKCLSDDGSWDQEHDPWRAERITNE